MNDFFSRVFTLADNSKIKKVFGWQLKVNLKDWINGQK